MRNGTWEKMDYNHWFIFTACEICYNEKTKNDEPLVQFKAKKIIHDKKNMKKNSSKLRQLRVEYTILKKIKTKDISKQKGRLIYLHSYVDFKLHKTTDKNYFKYI